MKTIKELEDEKVQVKEDPSHCGIHCQGCFEMNAELKILKEVLEVIDELIKELKSKIAEAKKNLDYCHPEGTGKDAILYYLHADEQTLKAFEELKARIKGDSEKVEDAK
jgi:hypothetical protein